MCKKIGVTLLAISIWCAVFAQQIVNFRQSNIVSPIVNENSTVTFKLRAPLAKTVTINGDWEINGGVGKMTKDTEGNWSYTTTKLPSDLYLYYFLKELFVD